MFKSKFTGQTTGTGGSCGAPTCVSTDESSYSALLLLANAYADLGTYHGITPYVGAGIGGAHLKWDDLRNTVNGTTTVHRGTKSWRFAYALMAGASYCLTDKLKLDVGYRYARIEGGKMFGYATGAGPGYDARHRHPRSARRPALPVRRQVRLLRAGADRLRAADAGLQVSLPTALDEQQTARLRCRAVFVWAPAARGGRSDRRKR